MLDSRCHPASFQFRLRDLGSEPIGADHADRPDRFAKASWIAPRLSTNPEHGDKSHELSAC